MKRNMSAFERSISETIGFALTRAESRSVTENAVSSEIEALVREHSRLVFRIAYSVVRNHSDAEDVVQEVFLRLAKHGARGIEDPKAWLCRIAWRASVDRYRSLARANHEEFDERMHVPSAFSSNTEQGAISRQTLALLDRMIATLPRKERDALLLISVEGMTSAEAAKVLGTTETSIRGRVFRARQRLTDKLQKVMGTSYGR
jgi:RNA polymerase sigma-70 factor (ECF subfamily)